MYSWKIDPLKTQLRAGRLPDGEGFRYALATFATISILGELATRLPAPGSDAENTASVASFVLVLFGTYAAYAANGGPRGTDFLSRLMSLGWVLGVRTFVAMILTFIVVGIGEALANPAAVESDSFGSLSSAILTVVFSGVFYWRLSVHMRDVAAPVPLLANPGASDAR